MKTIQRLRVLLIGFATGLTALGASAGPTLFNFSNEFSGTGLNCNGSCATLSVEQVGTGVNFIFTGTMSGAQFLTELNGNRSPYAVSTPSNVSKTGFTTANFASSQDTYKADGDGFFDWHWDFGSSASDRFNGTDVLSWTFADTVLADIIGAVSVNGPAGKNGFTFAVHAQGLANGGSGWLNSTTGGTPPTQIPEPGTALLAGLALLGLAASRKRHQG